MAVKVSAARVCVGAVAMCCIVCLCLVGGCQKVRGGGHGKWWVGWSPQGFKVSNVEGDVVLEITASSDSGDGALSYIRFVGCAWDEWRTEPVVGVAVVDTSFRKLGSLTIDTVQGQIVLESPRIPVSLAETNVITVEYDGRNLRMISHKFVDGRRGVAWNELRWP